LALPPGARKLCQIVPYDEAPVKNVESDRDSFIGRLLAETLEAHGAPVGEGSCLDAETLAAWADDTLGRRERATAEAHAASCARCQALLAVMMKTAPPAVAEKSAWRIPTLGWLIPLTAAAAAVLIWAIVPGRAPIPSSDRLVARASDRTPSVPGDHPVPVPRDRPASGQVATQGRSAAGTPLPAKPEAQLQRQLASSRASTDITAPSSAPRVSRDSSREEARAAALDKLEALEKVGQRAPVTTSAKEPSQAVIAGGGARVEPSTAAAAPAASPGVAAFASRVALARSGAAGAVIVSSSQASQWRLVPGGTVERSTDGGSTWQAQETGATVTLTGGASPSPSVCWLVGPTGTVLLSTDGRSWRRLAFPEATDLISVRAADEKIATVTASDGRTFSTRDGGLTWVRTRP
jgi:hypothetical protein